MDIRENTFLTSNIKKAKDFSNFGFGVQSFEKEIIEILSADVEKVALYKAIDTNLNNIIVEDTSLEIEGATFLGTEIKHVWETIENDDSFHNRKATWKVSLCLKKDNLYYIATGVTEGILKYPMANQGYHFDKLFAIKNNDGEYKHFELYTEKEKLEIGSRFKAIKMLKDALINNNYSKIKVIKEEDILIWDGKYQIENKKSQNLLKIK